MIIEEWRDEDFLPSDWQEGVMKDSPPGREILERHRFRQAHFNVACLKTLKKANRGWTLMIDTDEYLVPSFKALHKLDNRSFSSVETPGSTLELLNRLVIPHPQFAELDSPCIPVFRQQFSARESTDKHIRRMVPSGFDAHSFQTLRWRKYGYNEMPYLTKWGVNCTRRRWLPNKVLVDLGRLRLADITDNPDNSGNPHIPLKMCPSDIYLEVHQTPVMAHHYMATIDQWLYRQRDSRGTSIG